MICIILIYDCGKFNRNMPKNTGYFSENANSMTEIMLQNTALEKSLINDHARVLHVAHFGTTPSGKNAIVYH